MKQNENDLLNDDIRILEEIKKYAQDSRWQVRAAGARLLPVLGYKAPLSLLELLLADENRNVRIAALEACAPLAYRTPIELVMRLLDDEEWSVRSAAAWALGFQGIKIPAQRLLAMVDNQEEDRTVRASALVSLGKVYNPSYRERIVEALQDSAWEVREAAIQILEDAPGDLPDTLFIDIWQHDSSPHVRAAALRFIAHYRKHEALLWQALEDEEIVGRVAVEALKHVGARAQAELSGLLLCLPADSNAGVWIQEALEFADGDEEEHEITWEQIEAVLHPTFYQPGTSKAYPSHLSLLLLGDVLSQRSTSAWQGYIDALERLLSQPKEPPLQLATVHYTYSQVLECIGQTLQAQFPQWNILREQSLLMGLTFEIGDSSIEVRWHKEKAVYSIKGTLQDEDVGHIPVCIHLHFALWDDERQQLCPLTAARVLSGYTAQGQQLQQKLLKWLRQQNGFVQQQYE